MSGTAIGVHKHKKVDVAVKFFSRENPPKTVCLNLTNEVFRGGKSAVNGLMDGGQRGANVECFARFWQGIRYFLQLCDTEFTKWDLRKKCRMLYKITI